MYVRCGLIYHYGPIEMHKKACLLCFSVKKKSHQNHCVYMSMIPWPKKKNYKLINFTNRQIDFPRLSRFLAVRTYANGVLGHYLIKWAVFTQGIMMPYADGMSLLKNKNILLSQKREPKTLTFAESSNSNGMVWTALTEK